MVQQRIVLVVLRLESRIDGFHTHVETQHEVVEVEAEAQAIADGQLRKEFIDLELSAWLFLLVA